MNLVMRTSTFPFRPEKIGHMVMAI